MSEQNTPIGNAGADRRGQALGKKDIESEIVVVPQWDDLDFEIRSMTGAERSGIMSRAVDDEGKVDFERMYPEIIIACTFDPQTGEKVFRPSDRDALNQKSSAALELLVQPALRLSGMDKKAKERAGKS